MRSEGCFQEVEEGTEAEPPLCYMVMDYIEGPTLADYLHETSNQGHYPSSLDIIYIMTAVSRALDYAHQHGLIQRDIKPSNILLDTRVPSARAMGEPVLIDFGIARRQGSLSATTAGAFIGTPMYMAPEQAQGRHDEPRSDLYSLGIILYEMMTGVTPFHGDSPLIIVSQHLHEPPTFPELINPRISPALSAVILRSIAKRPDDRYTSASEMVMALTQAFAEGDERPYGITWDMFNGNAFSEADTPSRASAQALMGRWSTLPTLPAVDRFTLWGSHLTNENDDEKTANCILTPTDLQLYPVPPLQEKNIVAGTVASSHPDPGKRASGRLIPPVSLPEGQSRLWLIKKWRGKKSIWLVLLILLIMLSVFGGWLSMLGRGQEDRVVGQLAFLKQPASLKSYNAIRIDIDQPMVLPNSSVYYAWLEMNGEYDTPHWQLIPQHSAIHSGPLMASGVVSLLSAHSLLLITREDADSPPVVPNTDPNARLYYAMINNTTDLKLDIKQCPNNDTATTCL